MIDVLVSDDDAPDDHVRTSDGTVVAAANRTAVATTSVVQSRLDVEYAGCMPNGEDTDACQLSARTLLDIQACHGI